MKFSIDGHNVTPYISTPALEISSSEMDDSSCSYVDLDGVTHNAKIRDKLTISLRTGAIMCPVADGIWSSLHKQTFPVILDVLGYEAEITCTCKERNREFVSADQKNNLSVLSFTLEEV